MDSKSRNVWIVIIVVLVIACCCVLALAGGAAVWLASRYAERGIEPFDLDGEYRERVEKTLAVSDAPSLEITNFAGSITIRAGEGDEVRIVATKKASSQNRLNRIEFGASEANGQVVIETEKSFTTGNASVALEITAPADSRVDLHTGAGEVEVRDITGRLDIHSGAGTIDVRGAQGTARFELGAGQITYEGVPSGDCRFQTGAGEIILRLPEDSNLRIDLGTGMGAVEVDFDVDGRVSQRSAEGVIGDGHQGSVFAHTGVGGISVRLRY
ncbi:MAG: hypothetical protein PVI07_02235 [Anaerolineae bacterium]|jgi:DUF4097 and DUF4098 domain-containing protein YvlB